MKTRKIFLFLLLAFTLSWAIAGLIYFLDLKTNQILVSVLLILYMYMPALSVLIVQKFIYKEPMIRPLKISFNINIFFFWALFLPFLITFVAAAIGLLFPDVTFQPDMKDFMETLRESSTPQQMERIQNQMNALPVHPIWVTVVSGFIAAATINALAAFGEELGWRGFLLSEFREKNFFQASLIIGIIWGLWHAPIILMGHNYSMHPQWGVLFMTLFCILYTFLFIYITLRARSVIAASLMHGAVNAFAGIPLMISSRSSDLLIGNTGLAGFITLLLAIGLLFIYDRWIGRQRIMTGKIGAAMDAR